MKISGPPPTGDCKDGRLPLDKLVERLDDPGFRHHHPRSSGLRETSAHANPLMLASAEPDSAYVKAWRNHAENCPACRKLFEYFGLDVPG
ncbi:MAG: hypothetical protein K8R59_18435 [Thermoanaerobaculales bacterium]|nr:hypothetical protein [Thermoanaerobaculales bacterium]